MADAEKQEKWWEVPTSATTVPTSNGSVLEAYYNRQKAQQQETPYQEVNTPATPAQNWSGQGTYMPAPAPAAVNQFAQWQRGTQAPQYSFYNQGQQGKGYSAGINQVNDAYTATVPAARQTIVTPQTSYSPLVAPSGSPNEYRNWYRMSLNEPQRNWEDTNNPYTETRWTGQTMADRGNYRIANTTERAANPDELGYGQIAPLHLPKPPTANSGYGSGGGIGGTLPKSSGGGGGYGYGGGGESSSRFYLQPSMWRI
jgi:uncharacterized membrane protein YgcG